MHRGWKKAVGARGLWGKRQDAMGGGYGADDVYVNACPGDWPLILHCGMPVVFSNLLAFFWVYFPVREVGFLVWAQRAQPLVTN